MKNSSILIIDDDPDICDILSIMLRSNGYTTDCVHHYKSATKLIQKKNWDLIILDVMLPEIDGYTLCQTIRRFCHTPILFLTSKTSSEDQITCYKCGGDDYLAKPFSKDLLLHRVEAILRRYIIYQGKDSLPSLNDKIESSYSHNLQVLQKTLTDLEMRILDYFLLHEGQCCSSKNIYEAVWHEPYFETSRNTLMVHIYSLRKKIEKNGSNYSHIRTVWGKGYQFERL